MTEKNPLLAEHYPQNWGEFVGQEDAKYQLRLAAKSAARRGARMGHVLIASKFPGIGKTSLALLAGQELGVTVKIQSGPVKASTLRYLFADLQDGDVLFVDEIHRLIEGGGKDGGGWLFHYLQDGVLIGALGTEPDIPQVTVIAATTDAGKIPQPIRERFEITPTLAPYSDAEGAQIARVMSGKILEREGLEPLTKKAAAAVASAGNNSPRLIRRILCAVRDLAICDELPENGGNYELTKALRLAGVTHDGLSAQAQKYLIALYKEFGGQPVGRTVLRQRVGEVGGGMDELEDLLTGKGLVQLTKQGQMLTTPGIKRTRTLMETGA